MEDSPRLVTSGLSRRGLFKSSLILGLGAAGLSAASTAVTASVAHASQVSIVNLAPDYGTYLGTNTQTQWAYCNGCRNIWYTQEGAHSCASPDVGHQMGSSTDYGIFINNPGFFLSPPNELNNSGQPSKSGYQSPWYWCGNCSCLFYGPGLSSSYCANQLPGATSPVPHTKSGSGAYYVPYGVESGGGAAWTAAGATLQQGWKYCSNCKCLYWGNALSASWCQYKVVQNNAGVTISNFEHAAGSTVYYLAMM